MLRYFVFGIVALLILWRVPQLLILPLTIVALIGLALVIRSALRARRAVTDFGPAAQAVMTLTSARSWRVTAANLGLVNTGQRARGLMGRPEAVTFIPRVLRTIPTPYGADAIVAGAPGQDLSTWAAASGRLASALGVAAVTVTEPVPNQFVLALRASDPLAAPISSLALGPANGMSLLLGLTESGHWAHMSLANHSGLLLCGAPGSGKTAWLTQAVGGVLTYPEAQLLLIDGKAGHDLDSLAQRSYLYLTGDQADPLTVLMALRDVQSLMRRRLVNAVEWFGGTPNYWSRGPHVGDPVVLVVIDEAQTYLDPRSGITKDEKALISEIQSVAMDLIKKGRSAGIVVVIATQKGTTDAIPSAIRDQCGLRVCFRVQTREAVEAGLGQLPPDAPSPIGQDRGVGVAVSPEVGVIRFRSPYIAHEVVESEMAALGRLTFDPTRAEVSNSDMAQGITEGDPA
jgi:hypothetical protein